MMLQRLIHDGLMTRVEQQQAFYDTVLLPGKLQATKTTNKRAERTYWPLSFSQDLAGFLMATQGMIEVTFSQQWIHLLSLFRPLTSDTPRAA